MRSLTREELKIRPGGDGKAGKPLVGKGKLFKGKSVERLIFLVVSKIV